MLTLISISYFESFLEFFWVCFLKVGFHKRESQILPVKRIRSVCWRKVTPISIHWIIGLGIRSEIVLPVRQVLSREVKQNRCRRLLREIHSSFFFLPLEFLKNIKHRLLIILANSFHLKLIGLIFWEADHSKNNAYLSALCFPVFENSRGTNFVVKFHIRKNESKKSKTNFFSSNIILNYYQWNDILIPFKKCFGDYIFSEKYWG